MAPRPTIVYRCDAGHSIGMGHVSRGIALAEAVRRRHGHDVVFAGRLEQGARVRLERAGFALELWNGTAEADWLCSTVRAFTSPVLVWDARTPLTRDELAGLKPDLAGLMVMDDASDRRLAADLAILPPTPTAHALAWPGFHGRAVIGWDWVVLGRPPLGEPHAAARTSPPWRLLITMGGADPQGFTLRAAAALAPFAGELAPIVVLGPAFAHRSVQADSICGALPAAEIIWQTDDLRPLMMRCDAALTSFGVTAQELAACGVPAISLCLSDDHAQSAAALADTGACLSLGRFDLVTDETLRETVMTLLRDPARRDVMAHTAARVIDGKGAERIADALSQLLQGRTVA